MKVNDTLSNLLYAFGVCDTDDIHSINQYLARLYELKFELEDAMIRCESEISNVEQERRPCNKRPKH